MSTFNVIFLRLQKKKKKKNLSNLLEEWKLFVPKFPFINKNENTNYKHVKNSYCFLNKMEC